MDTKNKYLAMIEERSADLLTPRQLAALSGRSVKTLANWRCQKLKPDYITIGKRVMYPKAEVFDWLREVSR